MPEKVQDLEGLLQVFQTVKQPIVGVGVTAFNRLGMETLLPQYRIVCLRYGKDTPHIEKDVNVYSLERGRPARHLKCRRNSTAVLLNRRTQKFLKNIHPKPALIFYKTTEKIYKTCRANGWTMIGNPPKYGKKTIENKVFFRGILDQCKIELIPGETSNLSQLDFTTLNQKYGPRFVIQLPDRGGGKGTFFINSQDDFLACINHDRVKKYQSPPDVVVTKFIHGPSPSLTACVTHEGIISTNLQYQLLDIPELWNLKKGSGLFSGHDWTQSNFSPHVEKQGTSYALKIGEHLANLGYRGIFGLDMLLDQETEKLYVVECNPRLLGSFPCLPMVQYTNGEPPILGFHVLEFLNHDYHLDVASVNAAMRRHKTGTQMILHNLTYKFARNMAETPAGVYRYHKGKFVFERPGYHFRHLKTMDEFFIADGVPVENSKLTPNQRLFRAMTLRGVLDLKTNKLNQWGHAVATWLYQQLKIEPTTQQPSCIVDD